MCLNFQSPQSLKKIATNAVRSSAAKGLDHILDPKQLPMVPGIDSRIIGFKAIRAIAIMVPEQLLTRAS